MALKRISAIATGIWILLVIVALAWQITPASAGFTPTVAPPVATETSTTVPPVITSTTAPPVITSTTAPPVITSTTVPPIITSTVAQTTTATMAAVGFTPTSSPPAITTQTATSIALITSTPIAPKKAPKEAAGTPEMPTTGGKISGPSIGGIIASSLPAVMALVLVAFVLIKLLLTGIKAEK